MNNIFQFQDLREWCRVVESLGELSIIKGADWDLEIGAASGLIKQSKASPALLFDDIKGYPTGYRVMTGSVDSLKRFAMTVGFPLESSKKELIELWRRKTDQLRPIAPVLASEAPVYENVHIGDEIDLFEFPVPKLHPLDGGRYIGTGGAVITSDPDSGRVNLGTYRTSVVDRNHLACHISPGKHGLIHRDKWFERSEDCPVAFSFGHDPLLFLASNLEVDHSQGMDEYGWAGGIKGQPIPVVKSRVHGLPIPANAEIVVEGRWLKDKMCNEGPFAEWTGYYANSVRGVPLVEVEAVYHRNDPIILAHCAGKARGGTDPFRSITRSALIQLSMEAAGVPYVTGVWPHETGGRFFTIISIKQRYPGHARQAGLIASQCGPGVYMGKYIVVVDDDIDVTNMDDVIWAMATRSDPARSIEIIKRCRSGPLDPAIPLEEKGWNSRVIIDACKPYEWKDKFATEVTMPTELEAKVMAKWGRELGF